MRRRDRQHTVPAELDGWTTTACSDLMAGPRKSWARLPHEHVCSRAPMLDRFSENARQAMSRAHSAAERQRSRCVEVEHLLIGLLEVNGGYAQCLLGAANVDVTSLLEAMSTLRHGAEPVDECQPAFSAVSKRALAGALAEAAHRGDSHIGTQHILMGITRDGDNDAARVLARLGATPEALEQAMTATTPSLDRSKLQLLLISNSTMHGGGYLEHCEDELRNFLSEPKRVLFVPFALQDHGAYAEKARPAFEALGHQLRSAHTFKDAAAALDDHDAVFVGGGNTFRLLAQLEQTGLLEAIRARALDGMPYVGSSAGTNVATRSIRTTNDMPIVQPRSFEALQLLPFQINPHFLDPDPDSEHMGETREERISQFHEEHDTPVLGLREGCMLRADGAQLTLRGTTAARLLRRGAAPAEFHPPSDLSFLLGA